MTQANDQDDVLHEKNVVHMTCGTDVLHFYYDAQGKPAIVIFNGTAYGYLYNLQADVIALVDGTGAKWDSPLPRLRAECTPFF